MSKTSDTTTVNFKLKTNQGAILDISRDLFMSYNLLRLLISQDGSAAGSDGTINLQSQSALLLAAIQERDAFGTIVGDEITDIANIQITEDENTKVMRWVTDHIMDFLERQVSEAQSQMLSRKTTLESLATQSTQLND